MYSFEIGRLMSSVEKGFWLWRRTENGSQIPRAVVGKKKKKKKTRRGWISTLLNLDVCMGHVCQGWSRQIILLFALRIWFWGCLGEGMVSFVYQYGEGWFQPGPFSNVTSKGDSHSGAANIHWSSHVGKYRFSDWALQALAFPPSGPCPASYGERPI